MEENLVQRNKDIRRGTFAAFIFVIFVMGISQILSFSVPGISSHLCSSICMIVATIIILAGKGRPEKGTLLKVHNKMNGVSLLVLLGAFMACKLLSLVPAALLTALLVSKENAAALESLLPSNDNPILYFVFLGIVTPFGEELVFRGYIGNKFRKYGIWFAMIMSSLLFAMYHMNIFQLITAFLPGVVLFYIAMNYSIKWSILFHFINNGLLSIGFSELKKVIPPSVFADYGEYMIEIVLIIVALCLLKKDNAVGKVKSFLGESKNEKGVYKASIRNVWFILILVLLVLMSLGLLLGMNGLGVQAPQA